MTDQSTAGTAGNRPLPSRPRPLTSGPEPAPRSTGVHGTAPVRRTGAARRAGVAGVAGVATVLVLGGGAGGYLVAHAAAGPARAPGVGSHVDPRPGSGPPDQHGPDGGFGDGPVPRDHA